MAFQETINEARGLASKALGFIGSELSGSGMPVATSSSSTNEFPPDLGDSGRPFIRFACFPSTQHHPIEAISFPCPSGISFGDGATYSTIDVGTLAAIGEVAQAGIAAFNNPSNTGNVDSAMNAVGGSAMKAYSQLSSGGIGGAAIIAARKVGMDNVAQGLEFGAKQVLNPRTNTTFAGNTLRNFQFDFKMIAQSAAETNTIHAIHSVFRNNLYAAEVGGESIMLKYPNQWEITFHDPANPASELKHVPKIYRTYLTGLTTVVNSSANTFHKDMSPYEIDVSLQFQETKILTRQEMERLQMYGDRTNKDEELAQQFGDQIGRIGELAGDAINKFSAKVSPGEEGSP
mgnify:FL=1|tara:strand:- start:2937 stop:3974 length:1038 start_codon:yes stop_codon:yes gene_type:complete